MKKVYLTLLLAAIFSVFPATLDEEILSIAGKGDIGALEAILAKGASVNARNKYTKTTVLMEAVSAKPINMDFVKLLVAKGADINAKDKYGETALMVAANNRAAASLEACDFLLSKGAQIDVKNEEGVTALMRVSRVHARGASIRFFIEKGADLNAKDKKGRTALAWARSQSNDEGIQILEAAGAK